MKPSNRNSSNRNSGHTVLFMNPLLPTFALVRSLSSSDSTLSSVKTEISSSSSKNGCHGMVTLYRC